MNVTVFVLLRVLPCIVLFVNGNKKFEFEPLERPKLL